MRLVDSTLPDPQKMFTLFLFFVCFLSLNFYSISLFLFLYFLFLYFPAQYIKDTKSNDNYNYN